ncbi:MAG: hypothetical protein JKY19_04955 [Alcanivoracaceae bacterium]|nr:hypothetical protein [Alcanivoracaceae bacterium]
MLQINHRILKITLLAVMLLLSSTALYAALTKAVVQVDPGNTKQTGQTFTYVLSYSCSNTVGDCLNARIVDVLPPEVVYLGHAVTSDVASVNAPGVGSNGTVEFIMNSPLTAGNAGDVTINVRFPVGTTPNGTLASNTADGINLETTVGSFPTNTVDVTAVANVSINLSKTLLTNPSPLDLQTRYRLRANNNGELNVSNLTFTDTLPLGDLNPNPPIFLGATPAADCEPGCVGSKVPTLIWSGLSVNAGQNRDITVRVQYESVDFSNGDNVTNSFTADGDPLGEPPQNFGVGNRNHNVVIFVPNPGISFVKSRGGPNPAALNQEFYYFMRPRNTGNVDLENMIVLDTLPVEFSVNRVRTGRYNNNLSDFAVGIGVQIEYQKNTVPGVWALWGSSPNRNTNTTLNMPAPGLIGAEYITHIRWLYGTAAPGMDATSSSNRPRIFGEIISPDNLGANVNIGDTIQNCADLDADYPLGTPLTTNTRCSSFNVSNDFIQFDPDKDDITNNGPYVGGDTINWRLRARSHVNSSIPLPLEQLTLTDLLPLDLEYAGNYVFNPATSGIAAPDNFEQIANFGNSGRILLRWSWNIGAGNLPVGTYADINFDTTVRNGAQLGNLDNRFDMQHDDPTLDQRCSQSTVVDILDLDNDADITENLCGRTDSVSVLPVAQLISAKIVEGTCDGGFTGSSSGTLNGGAFPYKLSVQNTGTVTMDSFTLVDILPHIGDTGVVDISPRGSQWEPLLVSPIVGPPGVAVFYSTSGNPCRGEVGGPTTGCDIPNWTTVPPTPITDTKSFKLDFGSQALVSQDTLDFTFNMTAPANIPTAGEQAFNSFAWQALRSDFGTPLGAEPNKIGLAFGNCPASSLGNYVWVDNDTDGIQNDGNTGLNNVQMFLFAPGTDGVPGTFDDVQLATTITMNGPMGNPGWYLFPGLAAGDYYVCADVPATFAATIANQGMNDTLDSDMNPATSCTSVVTLGVLDENLDLDIGLFPPIPAALGNYVWFDRNSDGLQNESPFDGVNGITVNLFVDDGDSMADPATDTLVAVRATSDDANGIPGYYEFDQLSPGVPYFVQFILPPTSTNFTSLNSGSDVSIDSDADTSAGLLNGVTHIVTLLAGEFDSTIDAGLLLPSGNLSLGNQVWFESDNDGQFEPQNGEFGINGVELSIYKDLNADGTPSIDEYVGATATFTSNGLAGRYSFAGLDSGEFLVVVNLNNFSGSGQLAGLQTCTGNDPAPDPDDDINGDDNGTHIGANIASFPVTLSPLGEPINDGDSDDNSNLGIDFCFTDAGVTVPEYDYGDNPDVVFGIDTGDYRTVALDQGAFHQLLPAGPYLGNCVDADAGVNQNSLASQDDNSSFGSVLGTCTVAGDDEDGVVFSKTSLRSSEAFTVTLSSSSANNCTINAWIDWNRDGDFNVTEQIATNLVLMSGVTPPIALIVPPTTLPGPIYSRFRCSTLPNIGADGFALDGEVEDYTLNIVGDDLGDLPDSYGTLSASAGPSHTVDTGALLMLGSCVDTELDGSPSINANGDDLTVGTTTVGLCVDDEDGISAFPVLTEIATSYTIPVANITVDNSSGSITTLHSWLDFDGNGQFEADEYTSSVVNIGAISPSSDLVWTGSGVSGLTAGSTYARFRLTSDPMINASTPGGLAINGEVEDYLVTVITAQDWGDAPDPTYPTLLASNGPRHVLDGNLFLGTCVDDELDGQPTAIADGDDNGMGNNTSFGTCLVTNDDEDSVVLPSLNDTQMAPQITIITVNNTGADATLSCWIDYNGNGGFDNATERGIATVANGDTSVVVTMPDVPATANTDTGGATYLRCRIASSSAEVNNAVGFANNGEVEDHVINIDPVFTLGDYVWLDANKNGIQDISESGVNAVTVTLFSDAVCTAGNEVGMPVNTVNGGLPAADGFYQFTDLLAGTYCLQFTNIPLGFEITPNGLGSFATGSDADPTTARIENIVLNADDPNEDTGLVPLGSVSGLVWCESGTNPNTSYDVGDSDSLQSNITVTLYEDTDCSDTLNGSEATTAVTQDTVSGLYSFTNLVTGAGSSNPPGCYIVIADITDPDLGVCDNPITATPLTPDITTVTPNNPSNNFGHNEQLSLGDYVWYDSNQDGIQDLGEPGINGVTVNLYTTADCSGSISQTTATANVGIDGFYQFTPLASGMYCVEFIPPAGFTISPTGAGTVATDSDADINGQVQSINLQASDQTIDMGVYVPGSVSGLVWCESATNPNSSYDAGDADTLQSNIAVTLYEDGNCNDTLDGSEASTANTQDTVAGNYLFSNLITGGPGAGNNPPGCYIVQVDTADTDLGVCDNSITPISLTPKIDAPNPDNPNNDFGNNEQLSLGDYVWYDSNQDGIQDMGEPGINGVTVNLYTTADCSGAISQTTATANVGIDGFYQFTPLASGMYCVEFIPPAGFTISPTGAGTVATDSDADINGQVQSINLQASDQTIDMGVYVPGSVSGLVWCESATNPNSSYDAGDADTLQSNIAVTLYEDGNCNDVLDGSEASTANTQDTVAGNYLFNNLITGGPGAGNNPPGCYIVQVDTADTDLGVCDNPITPSPLTPKIDAPNPDNPDNNFGHDEMITLGDRVWYDNNQDGIQDINEPGVNAITVDLYNTADCSGSVVQTTITTIGGSPAADGWYEFSPLASGDYCIAFSNLPVGWVFTQTNQGSDDAIDSDTDEMTGQITNINLQDNDPNEDAGIYAAIGTIPGNMFCDFNPVNGMQDAGEEQPNVTINLYRDTDCNGTSDVLYDSQETDLNGNYEFINVPVALSPAPPNPQACYVVSYDTQDSDLGDCTAPILPEEDNPNLSTDDPNAPPNTFGITPPVPILIPVNSIWSILLLMTLILIFVRRDKIILQRIHKQ